MKMWQREKHNPDGEMKFLIASMSTSAQILTPVLGMEQMCLLNYIWFKKKKNIKVDVSVC